MNHTFVVCAYKESEYLEECINSLLTQTRKSNILVSTSTPNKFLDNVTKKYNLPMYINKGESGITQDWNFAISKAKTRFVTVAHQDDKYEPTYTEQVIGAMEASKDPILGFTGYYEIRNGKRYNNTTMIHIKERLLLPMRISRLKGCRFVRRRCLSFGDPVICPSIAFDLNKIKQPIFDNHYLACEDWEMLEKCSKMKGDFLYIPDRLTGHRIHEESTTTLALEGGIRAEENLEMFQKFWPISIAKKLNHFYNKSEKFNNVDNI